MFCECQGRGNVSWVAFVLLEAKIPPPAWSRLVVRTLHDLLEWTNLCFRGSPHPSGTALVFGLRQDPAVSSWESPFRPVQWQRVCPASLSVIECRDMQSLTQKVLTTCLCGVALEMAFHENFTGELETMLSYFKALWKALDSLLASLGFC